MILCNKHCLPACDFCIYSERKLDEEGYIIEFKCRNGKDIDSDSIGSYCSQFHCFNVKEGAEYEENLNK